MYTYRGKDISELRRTQLRDVAVEIGVSAEGSKTEILERMAAFADERVIVELEAVKSEVVGPAKAVHAVKRVPAKVAVPVKVAKAKKTKHKPSKRR